MDSAAYEEKWQRERAIRKLREAEIEAKYNPKTYSHEEVFARVDQIIESARALYENVTGGVRNLI